MAHQPRTVHPDDIQDERLARVPLSAAYTYAYLPTVLDDAGRAKDQPAVLNGYLWPLRADEHSSVAMADDLDALVNAGLLCRYTVDDQTYVHDLKWQIRQQVSQQGVRPAASTMPTCPTHETAADDVVGETLRKVSEQINAFIGSATGSFDETRVRDAVSRAVEDVTFMLDPEKASSYGRKVREFLGQTGETGETAEPPPRERSGEITDVTVWDEVTDDPERITDDPDRRA